MLTARLQTGRGVNRPVPQQPPLLNAPGLHSSNGTRQRGGHVEVVSCDSHQPLGVALLCTCGGWAGTCFGGFQIKAMRRQETRRQQVRSNGSREWHSSPPASSSTCGLVATWLQLVLLVMAAHQPASRWNGI